MNYLVAALAISFGYIVASLLLVQQGSMFVQTWRNRERFDPTTVLQAAKTGGSMVVGAVLVVLSLVFHWRVVHGRLDWDWSLIFGHRDDACGELVEEATSVQPPMSSEVQTDPELDFCVGRCTAFCLENDD